jgi:transposase
VQQARRAWTEAAPGWDLKRLVFIDETGATTNMTRSYGRAPKGRRCIASAPLGHWQRTTFVAALRHQQLTAPMLTDGPMDGEVFLAYVQNFLCHKVLGVLQAIQAAGASLRYLPPYSPDLNPIEKLFAKLKALLRKAAARHTEALWAEIGRILEHFPPSECANYFAASGYVFT